MLTSRQSGKDAYSEYQPLLAEKTSGDSVIIDFDGVSSLSPGWADEFLTPLLERYGELVKLKNTSNQSVALTVEMLEEINKRSFNRV